ncbi:MAG: ABC transporter permease [Vicinamibacteria bacterium]
MKPDRFRWLVRLLPFDFRADYGRDMESAFREQHREAVAAGGAGALWRRTIADVARTAPREHLRQVAQDVRYALRAMARHRAFTAAALSTLALGIGANTAVFSLVWTVLLKPLPYAAPDRLVAVWNRWDGSPAATLSAPEYLDYAERTGSLAIAAQAPASVSLGGIGTPERVQAVAVTANLLEVLGTAPALGRNLRADEERSGNGRVALVSDALWRRRFGADPAVVGRTVSVDGEPFEIVGVLPRGFRLPIEFRLANAAEIVVPLELDRAASRARRGGHFLQAVARLAPGADLARARAETSALVADLARTYPEEHDQGNFGVAVQPLGPDLLGPSRPVLAVLAGAVALVLLLTCAHVAGLLLARSEGRRQELAVRAALGADRFRLVRQLLTEAAALALAGAALGLAVAAATVRATAALAPASLPRLEEAALDGPVLAFAAGTALLAALAFGALPALQISRAGVASVLGETARGGAGGRAFVRRALVASQVAIAVVLLAGAGLLLKSYARLQAMPAGFDPERTLSLRLDVPASRYPGRDEVTAFFARLLDDVRTLPGVTSAGAANGLPLAVSTGDWGFDIEGRPRAGSRPAGAADWFTVTPGYFETLRIPLVHGRLPASADGRDAPPVIFLNRTAARQLFAGSDAIGQRLRLTRSTGAEQPWRTVAGVVGDVRHRGLERAPRPEMYLPHAQFLHFSAGVQSRALSVVVRTETEPLALGPAVRAAVARLDPEVPVAQVRTMGSVVAGSLADRRRDLALLGAFAALALALSAVGLYGLCATTVAQRSREIGVRMALGAARAQVAGLVLGESLRLAQAGLAAGLAVALLAAGALRGMLFEVAPRDAGVLAAVAALLLATSALASLAPALRAARSDPAATLRDE